jgi:hypothetical protein
MGIDRSRGSQEITYPAFVVWETSRNRLVVTVGTHSMSRKRGIDEKTWHGMGVFAESKACDTHVHEWLKNSSSTWMGLPGLVMMNRTY